MRIPLLILVSIVSAAGCVAPVFQGDDDPGPAPAVSATGGMAGSSTGGAAGKATGGTQSGGGAQAGKAGAAGAGAGASGQSGAAGGGAAGAGAGSAGAAGAGAGGAGSGGGGAGGAAGSSTSLVQLALGHHHTCGVTGSGDVACWGANDKQQVTNDTGETCEVELGPNGPEPVACARSPFVRQAPSGALQVASGDGHTCARTANGVSCWGDDADGQLGDGTAGGARGDAAAVVGIGATTALGAGAVSTCALDVSGVVWCWGGGTSGQLGQGVAKSSAKPVQVALGGSATALAVGGYHVCALLSTGHVACWGLNLYGELGDGTKKDSPTPKEVQGLTDVSAIAAGGWHTCARSLGTVLCWGSNTEGQIGSGATGSFTGVMVPTLVPAISDVDGLFAGRERTCVTKGGGVVCWGSNAHGELGIGVESSGTTASASVKNLAGVVDLALGGSHSCALGPMNKRACWGWNAFGQLGTGSTVDASSP